MLDAQRAAVLAAFRDDPRLRDVLLLSNDEQYELFESSLGDTHRIGWNARTRRRADLFTPVSSDVSRSTRRSTPASGSTSTTPATRRGRR
jgi:hypothetical protein